MKYFLDDEKTEYDEALADNVYERIQTTNIQYTESQTVTSYFVDEVAKQVKKDLINELGYTDLNVFLNLFPNVTGNQLSAGTDKDLIWEDYIRGLSDTGVEYLSFDKVVSLLNFRDNHLSCIGIRFYCIYL